VVYFHGGGWVIADIDTYDASARGIAAGAKAVVVSADYRHAPEHKFPAAHDDANAAYKWAVENSGSFNGDATKHEYGLKTLPNVNYLMRVRVEGTEAVAESQELPPGHP
ncbi:hypothetical protein EON80_25300, partial [bacterium]